MIAAILVMAAAGLEPPLPPAKSPFAYPPQAAKLGREGAVVYSVFVNPDGTPARCDVEKIFGADFGKLVCDGIMHATFMPAMDSAGAPAFGVFRTISNFYIPAKPRAEGVPPSAYPMMLTPEMVLEVKPVAGLLDKPMDVRLSLLIDAQGAVADCGPFDPDMDRRLVATACRAAKGGGSDRVRTDGKGRPVAFVRALTVEFLPK